MSTTITTNIGGSLTATTLTGNGVGITNIPRTALQSQLPNGVVVNTSAGTLTSEITLQPVRGGLGANFSTIGAGPFVVSCSSGAFSATVPYGTTSTPNSLIQRDSAGDIVFTQNAGAYPGIVNQIISAGLQTSDATPTTIYTFPTAQGTGNGTAYYFTAKIAVGGVIVGSGGYDFIAITKNNGGVTTTPVLSNKVQLVDTGLLSTDVGISLTGNNVLFTVTGLSARTILWNLMLTVVSIQY